MTRVARLRAAVRAFRILAIQLNNADGNPTCRVRRAVARSPAAESHDPLCCGSLPTAVAVVRVARIPSWKVPTAIPPAGCVARWRGRLRRKATIPHTELSHMSNTLRQSANGGSMRHRGIPGHWCHPAHAQMSSARGWLLEQRWPWRRHVVRLEQRDRQHTALATRRILQIKLGFFGYDESEELALDGNLLVNRYE